MHKIIIKERKYIKFDDTSVYAIYYCVNGSLYYNISFNGTALKYRVVF